MFFPIMAYVSTYVTFIAVKPLHYRKYTAKPLLRSLWYLCVVVISIFRTALTIPQTQVRFDNSQEILQVAQKSSLECVYQKLSCLAVRQPSRSLIGVAMAEGICVE